MVDKLEKAVVVGIFPKGTDREHINEYMTEIKELAFTAGAEVVEEFVQELEHLNPRTAIGKGKLQEIKNFITEQDIHLVIFEDDLTPSQLKNLEQELQAKVVDRSGLILDIFANHARTVEAKLQVELAQSQYLLPRLTRMWTHLSKQYGGIRTKGPGETQIETDRRLLRQRIQLLKSKLKDVEMQRSIQRKERSKLPRFALVGYTNAGKSTLMNSLTKASVYVEDKLFATLDTTTRHFYLPNGKKALLSDTVGFIRKLPAHLIASFRSTLAEASEADVIVHVVDVTYKYKEAHIKVVEDTLQQLKITNKPIILVFNKIDLIDDYHSLKAVQEQYPESVFVSALTGLNLQKLLEIFQEIFEKQSVNYNILIPFNRMDVVSKVYNLAEVVNKTDREDGIFFQVLVEKAKLDIFRNHFKSFILN